ncbi:TonB-dependent receptor [Marinimicrobium sp. ARAG 43.8]|uniref:TonB-dependent receptor n=1 Tax=Marinimicrobium sp. ARAG 43.8 TaxID=3418719 RepID=UPI003CEA2196
MTRQPFHKTVLAQLISATLLAGASGASLAQQTGQPDDASAAALEEVVVRGIRGSMVESLDRKREADTFVEVVVAEDIGKLPDDNLAETLQRVPGIQVEREDGEGVNITIRGIRNNRVEVNGRTLLSPYGRGTNAGIMNYFPSEIVGSVRTTKVLTADMTDGALGGTVDIKTRKPLDRKGFWGGASAEGTLAEMNDDQGVKLSAQVSNTFADDTMGVMFGVVHEDRPITEDRFYSNGDWRQGAPYSNPENNVQGIVDPYYYQYDLRYQRKEEEREKSAVNGAFQWQPSDNLDINADLLYAEYDYARSRSWAGIILDKTLENYDPDTIVVDEHDARVAGTLDTKVESNHERYQGADSFLTGGLNMTWVGDSGLEVFAEYAFGKSETTRDQQFIQLYTYGEDGAGVPVSYDIRGTDIASVDIPDLSNPNDFTAATFYDTRDINEAEEDSFRLDVTYPMDGVITSVKAGLRYSSINATTAQFGKYGAPPYDNLEVTSLTRAGLGNTPVSDAEWLQNAAVVVDTSDVLSGSGANVPNQIVVVDTDRINGGGFGFSDAFYEAPISRFPDMDSEVEDTIMSYYVRADFDALGWTGNLGVRYSDTSTTVDNFALVSGEYEPYEKEGGYQDVLPSLIIKRDLTEDLVLRLGVSKSISRPSTRVLGATGTVNLIEDDPETPQDESEGSSASLPNPDLKPQRGTKYDVSLEWYFARNSALAAAVFYNSLDRQILDVTEPGTIPGYGDQEFNIRTQVNGAGGEIKGVELAFQHDFRDLPGLLGNTGTSINYTYLENTTDEIDPRTGDPIGLQGVSENSLNIQVYYEDDKLSSRLLYNWRDDYFDRLGYEGATAILNKGEPSLDASIKYYLTDAMSIEFQAVNLLDSPKSEYAGWEQYVATYAETGRRYSLGVSVKF